jgi:ubiquinone/menaquinone biosynthesis C-methylase UbiE
VARTGYFAINAILGTVGFELHEALVGKNSNNEEDDRPPLVPRNEKVATRLLLEAALSYQQDYDRIVQQNMYKVPWDMMTTTDNNNGGKGKQKRHRQSSPIHVATQSARFVQEAIGTLGRRKRATPNDKQVWIFGDETTSTNQNDENSIYPDYYRTAFHYQTDGWMSTRSAQVYETSTESLFLGRQDAMQRTALPALMRAARDFSTRQKILQKKRPMRVLEVACGTGRFLTFVRDNLPPDTEYTAVDLSPYYLEAARENDVYYRKFTTDDAKNKNNVVKKPTTFLQARAEDLRQLKDESFDAVVCMYLFHELPTDIRQEVAAEMARVVVPGGTVVLTDSVQQGDRPILDAALPNFQHMNEPHYISYMQDNLPAHFQRAGLECSTKYSCSTTKSLSFTKPVIHP